jgi:hypothetical protein
MVKVQVIPDLKTSDADEVRWAHVLGDVLRREFKSFEDGEVVVHAKLSTYGYGQKYNDLDVVLFAEFPTGIDRQIACKVVSGTGDRRETGPAETIRIYSLCLVLELKAQDPRSVRIEGLNILQVKYGNEWKDVNDQSEGQKHAFRAVLKDKLGAECWVCNAIWLTSFQRADLPNGIANLIPKDINFLDILRISCAEKTAYETKPNTYPFFGVFPKRDQGIFEASNVSKLLSQLARKEIQVGSLTRRKMEQVTAKLLLDQQYAKEIGKKLVIIQGRAGTGKTIKLLRIAHDLASRDGARVRLLTFNLALVSDIRRMTALTGINEESAGVVHITSLDKFFWELIAVSGLGVNVEFESYFEVKDKIVSEISQSLAMGLITDADLAGWRELPALRYDYILVDEAQDWPRSEQNILLQLYGPQAIVVADGMDQMVRGAVRSEWSLITERSQIHRAPPEKRCLRQKSNLNEFNRVFSRCCDLGWDLESRGDYPGGRVIIVKGKYTRDLHEELFKNCTSDGNQAYEMLFMVPPRLANIGYEGEKGFRLRDDFQAWGVRIWDGTRKDNRKEYPNDPLEHRVIQYESCRGLEAWTAVCMELDELFAEKLRTWQRSEDQQTIEDDDVLRCRYALKWCMMPLTRAIDTTVITLAGHDNKLAEVLFEAAKRFPDAVEIRT